MSRLSIFYFLFLSSVDDDDHHHINLIECVSIENSPFSHFCTGVCSLLFGTAYTV